MQFKTKVKMRQRKPKVKNKIKAIFQKQMSNIVSCCKKKNLAREGKRFRKLKRNKEGMEKRKKGRKKLEKKKGSAN